MRTKQQQAKPEQKHCSFCDFTGVIRNPYFEQAGGLPLTPCPKCVQNRCTCGGEDPYYYYDNGIRECYCRETRMKIDRIREVYAHSGIDRKYRWRFINEYESRNKLGEAAKSAAYDIIRRFPAVEKGLYLWGNPGTGKTLLSTIILTELITRHAVGGRYVKISRGFFQRLRSTFNTDSENLRHRERHREGVRRDGHPGGGRLRHPARLALGAGDALQPGGRALRGREVHHLHVEHQSAEGACGDCRGAGYSRGSRRCAAYSRSPVRTTGTGCSDGARLHRPGIEPGRKGDVPRPGAGTPRGGG